METSHRAATRWLRNAGVERHLLSLFYDLQYYADVECLTPYRCRHLRGCEPLYPGEQKHETPPPES